MMDFDLGVSNRRSSFRHMAERGSAFAQRQGWDGLNIVIPASMLVYAAIAAVLCFRFGHAADFRPMLYLPAFSFSYLMFGAIPLVIVLRRALGRGARPLPFFPRVWSPCEFLRSLIAAAPFLVTWPFFMAGFTAMKSLLNDVVPFTWDTTFMEIGRALHFGHQPWQWLDIENPLVTRVLESAYAFWGVLLVAVPFAVALDRAGSPARTRFLISIILVFILLGNVAAGAFMSAGPFWFEFTGARHNDYAGLFAYLTQADPNGDFSAISFQRYLWHAYIKGATQLGTGISAFPSIHVAVATLYALYAWPLGRSPRLAATIYLLLIMVGAVHLGWHYAVDCYAGFLGAAMIYGAVGAVQRWHARLIASEPAVQSEAAVQSAPA
jgi:hypothetical protein